MKPIFQILPHIIVSIQNKPIYFQKLIVIMRKKELHSRARPKRATNNNGLYNYIKKQESIFSFDKSASE
jgi:hypothetical protein